MPKADGSNLAWRNVAKKVPCEILGGVNNAENYARLRWREYNVELGLRPRILSSAELTPLGQYKTKN